MEDYAAAIAANTRSALNAAKAKLEALDRAELTEEQVAKVEEAIAAIDQALANLPEETEKAVFSLDTSDNCVKRYWPNGVSTGNVEDMIVLALAETTFEVGSVIDIADFLNLPEGILLNDDENSDWFVDFTRSEERRVGKECRL